jgi:hypothetical protein
MTLYDAHGNPILPLPKGPEPLELSLPGGDEPLTPAQAEAAKDFTTTLGSGCARAARRSDASEVAAGREHAR